MIARDVVSWLAAFALTQAVEVPIWWRAHRPPWRFARAFGASAITHPVVWFVFPWLLAERDYWAMVASAEIFAVVVEATYARLLGVRRAWAWSLVANGASFGIGLLLYRWLGML